MNYFKIISSNFVFALISVVSFSANISGELGISVPIDVSIPHSSLLFTCELNKGFSSPAKGAPSSQVNCSYEYDGKSQPIIEFTAYDEDRAPIKWIQQDPRFGIIAIELDAGRKATGFLARVEIPGDKGQSSIVKEFYLQVFTKSNSAQKSGISNQPLRGMFRPEIGDEVIISEFQKEIGLGMIVVSLDID